MLLAGEIGKPHGTSGEVYVVRISDDPRRFDPGSRLTHSDGRVLVVSSSREHRNRFLVLFEGSGSREEAERLRGALFVPADETRTLPAGEYWERDLIGATAVLPDGERVGTIADIRTAPAQDLLILDTPRGERMVPFVDEIVKAVDVETNRVVIEPPEGLLD